MKKMKRPGTSGKVASGTPLRSIIKGTAALGIIYLAAALLVNAGAVAEGIRRGLSVGAGVLVPSLFPFMVLSGFLSLTDCGRIISRPFAPLTRELFKLPGEMGSVMLLSAIGGYPVGAKMIASMLDQGHISPKTASRMLCFCVNAGPSFLITAVGTGMFLDRKAGVILFASQLAASFLIGVLVSARAGAEKGREAERSRVDIGNAFVLSVTGASSSTLNMCAFAVLFSGLLELASSSGLTGWVAGTLGIRALFPKALLAGLFEVTSGCVAAAEIGGQAGFALTSAFVSFGGISVIFQVLSFFRGVPVRVGPFLLSRLVHMVLSTSMALPLYRKFCGVESAWAAAEPPHMLSDERTVWISICLMGMCTVLLISAGEFGRKGRR